MELNQFKLSDIKKAKISEVLASTESKLIKGGNEELNLMNLLMNMKMIISAP